MSFELSDDEALETLTILNKALGRFKYVIESGKKGARVIGKEKLEKRIILVEQLVNRLQAKYGR